MALHKALPYLPAVAALAVLGAGVYYFRQIQQAGQQAIKPLTDGLFNAYQWLNPPKHVEATSAFITIRHDQLVDGRMPRFRIDALSNMHPDNGAILDKILTADGVLIAPYKQAAAQYGLIGVDLNGSIITGVNHG